MGKENRLSGPEIILLRQFHQGIERRSLNDLITAGRNAQLLVRSRLKGPVTDEEIVEMNKRVQNVLLGLVDKGLLSWEKDEEIGAVWFTRTVG